MTPFNEPSRLRVLVTGGAGKIGTALRSHWRGRYGLLRLADIAAQEPTGAGEEICHLDMRDITSVEKSMEGMDCVVHLAGIPHEDTWDNILSVNIEGTYNAFEVARRQGVRRVVFASSNHVIGFHRREEVIDTDAQPRPDSRYGVSKVFGEALGSMYADKYGLSVACLRIGPFRTPDKPNAPRELMNWLSHADMAQLAGRCVEHPKYHFVVLYGVSNNTRNRWDNAKVGFIGYRPTDNAETFAGEFSTNAKPEDPIAIQFHGGIYCSREFVGDTTRMDDSNASAGAYSGKGKTT